MSSKVEICNIALASVRAKSINSLDEASVEAQQCKLHYDIARQFVLRDTPWQFAKKVAALALLSVEPLHWVYGYAYPIDCLKFRMVTGDYAFKQQQDVDDVSRWRFVEERYEPELSVPFEIQNISGDRVITTDETEAYGIYTMDIDNEAMFDPHMVMALAYYLGSLIAIPLTGADIGRGMRKEALSLYTSTISAAIANELNEARPPKRREAALVRVRR